MDMEVDFKRQFYTTTDRQMKLLIEFLKENSFLAYGEVRTREARAKAEVLWEECASRLNKEGAPRSGKGWCKVWIDNKCRIRGKARDKGFSSLSPVEKEIFRVCTKPQSITKDNQPMIDHNYQEFSIEKRSRSFSMPVKQEDTEYEVLEEFEVLDEDILQEPISILSPPPQSPKEHEPEEQSKRLNNADDKCDTEQFYATLMKIEKSRADAELRNARALTSIADSFRLIADSIVRLSQKYCEEDN